MKIFKKNEPGICPVCESDALKYVGHCDDGEYTINSWRCCCCKSAGDEVSVVVGIHDNPDEQGNFVSHEDVHDAEGNEWISKQED